MSNNSKFMCDGSTVYSLKHAGWHKGEEQFKNDIYFTVNADGNKTRATELALFLTEILNTMENYFDNN